MTLKSDEVVRCHIGAEGGLKGIELEARLGCAAGMMLGPIFDVGLMTRKDSVRDVSKDGWRGSSDRNWWSRDDQGKILGIIHA